MGVLSHSHNKMKNVVQLSDHNDYTIMIYEVHSKFYNVIAKEDGNVDEFYNYTFIVWAQILILWILLSV